MTLAPSDEDLRGAMAALLAMHIAIIATMPREVRERLHGEFKRAEEGARVALMVEPGVTDETIDSFDETCEAIRLSAWGDA